MKNKKKLNQRYIKLRNAVFERLMKLHGLTQLQDEYDGTPLKYKEDATEKEIKEGLYAVIAHRIDGDDELNHFHGTKLYLFLSQLDDRSLSENFQIISQQTNLLKQLIWAKIHSVKKRSVEEELLSLYFSIVRG